MADTESTATPTSPRGRGRGAYRGGGRPSGGYRSREAMNGIPDGGGQDSFVADSPAFRGRGRGRGREGGRGRSNRGRADSQHQPSAAVAQQDPATAQPPPQPGGAGVSGTGLTRDAPNNNLGKPAGTATQDGEGDGIEAEVCFICASPVRHNSLAPCNHRTCHVCALRLRALYKTKACAHCRAESPNVIFTNDVEKRYEDYGGTNFFQVNDNLGISFENRVTFEDTIVLLRYNCPDSSCDVACLGWPDLHRHVKSVHHKVMCDLCTRNKKVFTHEHELFTPAELRRHEKLGDDNPGAIDQSGFKGHPECGFCRQRFYGDDELYAHCRDRHERCHVCDRRNGGNNPRYFVDYNSLEQHFGKEHFPCLDTECLEKKFVVFDSEMDLKAHQLQEHPNDLSKDARRDARRVDLSSFNYRPEYVQERPQRGRGGRGGGRGRDPNAEGTPAFAPGHMSRAELAHARAREIQSAQSVSNRTFGGQLTLPRPPSQTVRQPQQSRGLREETVPQPGLDVLHSRPATATSAPASPRPAQAEALTPQEQARRLRHAAVTERANNLLHNDHAKLTEFRECISSYRFDALSAGDLIDAFFSLFDTSSAELGKLIKELAEIFEVPGKRDALLKAWSDWKAINEDYPSLPGSQANGPSTVAGILGSGIGGSRVLKLKSSTAQSSRSVGGGHHTAASWGSGQRLAGLAAQQSPGSSPFPLLPAAKKPAAPAPTSGWLALRPAAKSASSSARASPTSSRTQSAANLPKADAFPALPPGKKPTSTVFSPGYSGAGVLRGSGSYTPVNAWAGGGGMATNGDVSAVEEAAQGGGKKGKRGKQIVFQWG